MPHYIDIHRIDGATAAAVAEAHVADMAVQDKYGVNYVRYWVNVVDGKIFCHCTAPDKETANRVHAEAHGLVAERIIEVEPDLVEGFLGGGVVASTGAVMFPAHNACDPGVRTLMFTDLVDSTAMTQRLGDRAAMRILEIHDGVVRDALTRTAGREVKHLGDGIMAVFSSAPQAVKAAALIQDGIKACIPEEGVPPVRVRVGLASGEPVERQGDFFGSAVQLAARLCARASPGQTLCSQHVIELCADAGLQFEPLGKAELKGFEQPVPIYTPLHR